jgi:hypothetical protein
MPVIFKSKRRSPRSVDAIRAPMQSMQSATETEVRCAAPTQSGECSKAGPTHSAGDVLARVQA